MCCDATPPDEELGDVGAAGIRAGSIRPEAGRFGEEDMWEDGGPTTGADKWTDTLEVVWGMKGYCGGDRATREMRIADGLSRWRNLGGDSGPDGSGLPTRAGSERDAREASEKMSDDVSLLWARDQRESGRRTEIGLRGRRER